jgi:hypothetical protein
MVESLIPYWSYGYGAADPTLRRVMRNVGALHYIHLCPIEFLRHVSVLFVVHLLTSRLAGMVPLLRYCYYNDKAHWSCI